MKKKALVISISLIFGLLCAMETSAVQQMDVSQLIGGGCDCDHNSMSYDCPSPCQNDYIAAVGSGSGTIVEHTFCTSGTGCSGETKVESTYCDSGS